MKTTHRRRDPTAAPAPSLSPAERRQEVVKLLAAAALRRHHRPAAEARPNSPSALASGPGGATQVTVHEDLTATQEDRR